jgi:hypothetical protein
MLDVRPARCCSLRRCLQPVFAERAYYGACVIRPSSSMLTHTGPLTDVSVLESLRHCVATKEEWRMGLQQARPCQSRRVREHLLISTRCHVSCVDEVLALGSHMLTAFASPIGSRGHGSTHGCSSSVTGPSLLM